MFKRRMFQRPHTPWERPFSGRESPSTTRGADTEDITCPRLEKRLTDPIDRSLSSRDALRSDQPRGTAETRWGIIHMDARIWTGGAHRANRIGACKKEWPSMPLKINRRIANALWETHRVAFVPAIGEPSYILQSNAAFESHSQHHPDAFMPLGAYSYSLSPILQVAHVGRYCSIGRNVEVMGDDHPTDWISTSPAFYRRRRARRWESRRTDYPKFDSEGAPVTIGHDVWIGDGCLLGKGIHIGDGAIVGARSIVTRDVAPFSIVAGTPARVLRQRFDPELVRQISEAQWWNWPISAYDGVDPRDLPAFIARARELRETTPTLSTRRITYQSFLNEYRLGQGPLASDPER